MRKFRYENDSLGKKQVPFNAYYGVQSLRAAENFRITGTTVHPEMIKSIVEIKMAAAITNKDAGIIGKNVADAIVKACEEILAGNLVEYFIVDSIQGGAGTSFNMNANEVIANRAIELLGREKGDYSVVHPNDHVNCGQSTNDVYPSAGRIAVIRLVDNTLTQLRELYNILIHKSEEFRDIIKMGRTEMQDAVPISFGRVFGAYASAIKRDIERFCKAKKEMSILNLGGTAVGTGINADEEYIKNIVPNLSKIVNLELVQARDLVDATQNLDSFVYVSGIIKSCAATLSKISNDLRLMSSGPRTGFSEIILAPKQNGSSIMPGKVNPVIPEMMNQIAFNIIGNDATVTYAAEAGQLELNAFEPIIFRCIFESLDTLCNGIKIFIKDCIEDVAVNSNQCKTNLDRSVGVVTALCPYIGYTKASSLAKRALKENKSIRDIVISENIITAQEIDKILDPNNMV